MNNLPVIWAKYIRELLLELQDSCKAPIHTDQLREIEDYIRRENGGLNEVRI